MATQHEQPERADPTGGRRRGPRVLVTAGPTHEPIDEVRYLGNRSSGRMGLAIAEAAAARGWPTTLLLGPIGGDAGETQGTSLVARSIAGSIARIERFRSTSDLQSLLEKAWPDQDLLIMAAAVADHRPRGGPRPGKLSREAGAGDDAGLSIELEPTPDLVAALATTRRPTQRIVGFALEPADRLLVAARAKLERKGLDAIVANSLVTMDAATVTGHLLRADGTVEDAPPDIPKPDFARWLLDRLAEWFDADPAGPA